MKDILVHSSDKLKLKGEYVFTVSKIETEEQKALNKKIEFAREKGVPFMHMVRDLNRLCRKKVYRIPNTITAGAKTMVANNFANSSPDNVMKIDFSALGTGNTAVTENDTTLDVESYRRKIASASNLNTVVNVSAFYGAVEVNGTFYEHAIFADASTTTDSGVMISRVLLNPNDGITKSTSETLTIDYTLTIS